MFDEKPHRSIMMRDLRATQRMNKTGKNALSNEISKHPQCPTTASPALSYSAESIQHTSYCLFYSTDLNLGGDAGHLPRPTLSRVDL